MKLNLSRGDKLTLFKASGDEITVDIVNREGLMTIEFDKEVKVNIEFDKSLLDEVELKPTSAAIAAKLLEALKDARYALYGNGPGNPKIDNAIKEAEDNLTIIEDSEDEAPDINTVEGYVLYNIKDIGGISQNIAIDEWDQISDWLSIKRIQSLITTVVDHYGYKGLIPILKENSEVITIRDFIAKVKEHTFAVEVFALESALSILGLDANAAICPHVNSRIFDWFEDEVDVAEWIIQINLKFDINLSMDDLSKYEKPTTISEIVKKANEARLAKA